MKVVWEQNNEVKYYTLSIGDTFLFERKLYMVTDATTNDGADKQAVDLEEGRMHNFAVGCVVEKVSVNAIVRNGLYAEDE